MILYRRLLVSVPNVLWEPFDTAYVAFPHKIYLAVCLYRLHARTNGTLLTILKTCVFRKRIKFNDFSYFSKYFSCLFSPELKFGQASCISEELIFSIKRLFFRETDKYAELCCHNKLFSGKDNIIEEVVR